VSAAGSVAARSDLPETSSYTWISIMASIAPLRDFVARVTELVDRHQGDEPALLAAMKPELESLIRRDDWLGETYRQPHPQYYQQYLLHADPLERFSVVSFVWGPGQKTPIHDHRVWGLVGVLDGAETSTSFDRQADGRLVETGIERLERGNVVAVSPDIGDIHRVANAYEDRVSISIHIYGGNIGAVARAVYDPDTAAEKPFVSGYSNTATPNLWDRSDEVRAALVSA
jgi:predicted metal-dependent enzyme (double-stranded beta helix superfamily)